MTPEADLDSSRLAARMNLADQYVQQGDIPGAIRAVETLAAESPELWWIWEKLGELNARANRYPEAAAHFREAALRKRNDPSILYRWSRAAFDAGRLAEARTVLDEAARLAPGHDAILHLYAEIFERSADWENLGRVAQEWHRIQPQHPLPWMYVATAQVETGQLKSAMQSYRTFLDRGGRNAVNLATFGRLCLTALAYDDATKALDEAERIDPDCAHMLSAKATLSMYRGELEDARVYARRAIKVNPDDTAAFRVLVQVSGGRVTDDEQAQLRRLAENDRLPWRDRIGASFALADCLDAQGNTEEAFAQYEHANKLSEQRATAEGLRYDPEERRRQTEWFKEAFPSAPPTNRSHAGPTPIFIVGMPRSGTTLIESILGAHSKVFACGERQEMRSIMRQFASLVPIRGASGIPEEVKAQWRDAFLRELPDLGGATAITDKNPWNFDALGLIFDLFPDARVIHVRRNPLETGLSIFRNEFQKFASFATRLEDIGHYYGEYARLMAHWEAVLPNRFVTIQYEDVVSGFDDIAPKLLRFCGLAWEERCRSFSASNRVIATMSAVQARRPMTDFSGRGARYARYLEPLAEALRDAGVDLGSGVLLPDRLP